VEEPGAYHAEGILYLPAEARFDYLLNRPEAENIGAKVNAAMRDIEKHNPQLAGVLPKTYNLFTSTLLKELLKKVSEIPATADYDAFGRIYEYFLGEFARTEGQKGGEFYTPGCIVRLLTEVIEPYHGRILDPACGSGGMFVSSARFVAEHKRQAAAGHPRPSDGRGAGGEGGLRRHHISPTARADRTTRATPAAASRPWPPRTLANPRAHAGCPRAPYAHWPRATPRPPSTPPAAGSRASR
jgi:type I restriction enzyme M protein